ncbi:hypothetical protein [Pseudalkalibacillus sp. SCS-8]|uniref:hypothetical protein n=1 Tax=Pseudalkalibacillus nanhaiensis TaxID=3115291 RepID=UPI0032D9B598
MRPVWTKEELLEVMKAGKTVASTFLEAVEIVRINSDAELNKLTFHIHDGWKSRPESWHFSETMDNEIADVPCVFRLLSRHPHETDLPLKQLLLQEIGIVTAQKYEVVRVHGRLLEVDSYEHLVATLKLENGSVAHIEVAHGTNLTEVYELEAASKAGILMYRNEPLPAFKTETISSLDKKGKEKQQEGRPYTYEEIKKAIEVVDLIYASIENQKVEVVQ